MKKGGNCDHAGMKKGGNRDAGTNKGGNRDAGTKKGMKMDKRAFRKEVEEKQTLLPTKVTIYKSLVDLIDR
jgi:hypothetical protein